MKKNIFKLLVFAGLAGTVVLSSIAYAVGTPAGTVIQSRSRVVFTTASGATSDTAYSNVVQFTVLQVAGINSTPATNSSTTNGDSVYVTYPLTVTNSGNGTDYFTLTASSSKGWSYAFYHDANGNQVLDAGELSGGSISQTSNVTADSNYKIIVRVFVPRDGSLNGQTDTTTVTIKSGYNVSTTTSAVVKTTVNTAYFSGATSALTISPSNPSPGQNVTYTYTLTNAGSVAATGVAFSDLVNLSQFSVVSGSTTQGTYNGGTPATWSVGTVNPGGSVTVSIVLNVNSGLSNGSILSNTINVTYTVGGNTFTETSNTPSAAVGTVRGVSISPTSLASAKEPEDTVVYAMRVKNTGNAKEILELSYSSGLSYVWTFFKDVNGSGTLDGGDTQLTDTPGSPITGVDVDSVAANDSVKILARAVVPVASADQDQDVTTFTVKSGADPSKYQNATATTTVNMADVVVNRSVSPSGNQPPGQVMDFTVTYQNNGHGKAYNVVLTENEPDSMSYVANSVTINNVAKTDASGDDEVTVTTVGGKKVISISLGTINGLSAVGTIKYKATIH